MKFLPCLFLVSTCLAAPAAPPVRIGILAFRPKPQAQAQWAPLAGVLGRALPGREIQVETLTYPELDAAIAGRRVDFVLTNPAHYILLRSHHHLTSPLATLATTESGQRVSAFGGVILTRAGDPAHARLEDLRKATIAIPDLASLGGYQMQAYELRKAGLPLPDRDRLVVTGMPHDNVVRAVLEGRADAGFVRTGTLEAMAREGRLDPARIRVLQTLPTPYPVALSTRLYPEWPFAALPHADEQVARRVAGALLLLGEDDPAAHAMGIQGFAVPADYEPVARILRELRLPPYEAPPPFTFADVWARYRWPFLAVAVSLLAAAVLGIRLLLAHRRLRSSRELFALAFQMSPDPISIHRLDDGTCVAVNQGYLRATGHAREDLVGRRGFGKDYQTWADATQLLAFMERLRRDGAVDAQEATFLAKDGQPLTGVVSARILDLDGVPHVLAIARDVTGLRKAEGERRALEAQLHQAQKMESLGVLAGGVAHDMNNVLAAIMGLASAHVETTPEGTPTRKAFETILKAAERGGKLVKGLLRFARQNPAEERVLDLNALIQEEASLLERTTLARVRLRMELDPGLRPIRGEAGALANALMNLCVNAVEALPADGSLTLRTRNAGPSTVEAEVEDDGAGMGPEILERALDPFFTTKEPGKGTGLGLSMVYSTVKAHRGTLDIRSEPGRGTRVVLRFPAVVGIPAAPAGDTAKASGPARPLSVLVVDDDELALASTQALVAALGHTCTSAARGEEALALAGADTDLVIMDLNMPGLGGARTLPLLRARWPKLPVLLATGKADQTALDLVRGCAHVTLLEKPFTLADLRTALLALEPAP